MSTRTSVPRKRNDKKRSKKGGHKRRAGRPEPPDNRRKLNYDGRPEIKVTTKLHKTIDEAVEKLAADPDVYVRAYRLVHITRVSADEVEASPEVKPGFHELIEGTPKIHTMELATLRERLTRVASFLRFDERAFDWVPTVPNDHVVTGVLARKRWPKLRTLVGIAETPFLRHDGTICQTPGYDAATGFLCAPSTTFPVVAEQPTRADARAAYEQLAEVFQDFPFEQPGHTAVMIAALLTLAARPAIRGATPAFLLDANVRGAGKTLLTDCVSMIATGRQMPRKTYPRTEEEFEKVLGCYALDGAAVFSIDNINREFGGGCLDAYLTARDTVQPRILGKSVQPTVVWVAVIFGGGNNLQIYDDTSDRVLKIRLESPDESPRKRPRTAFRHPDLLAWVRENRPRLVAAVLTILRAYVVAGKPDMKCERWGSFEEWSELIPHAIVFAGGADPMIARIADETEVNDELRNIMCVVQSWGALIDVVTQREKADWKKRKEKNKSAPEPQPRADLSSAEAVEALYGDFGAARSAVFDSLRESVNAVCCPRQRSGEVRPTSTALSGKLRMYKGRNLGGLCLRSREHTHTKIHMWFVEDVKKKVAGVAGVAGVVSTGSPKLSKSNTSRPNSDTSGATAKNGPASPASPANGRAGVS